MKKFLITLASLAALGAITVLALVALGGNGGRGNDNQAWETTWQESTTRQEMRVVGCLQYTSWGNCFQQQTELVTVPGPTITRSDYVCARSRDEAERLAGANVTVTGRTLASSKC